MRVTNLMIFNQSTWHINRQYEEYFKLNEAVSSGKRVNRPSDDPVSMGMILNYRSLSESIEQYKSNIERGVTLLTYTESALADAETVITDAKVLAEQMATGTYNDENRESLSVLAEELYDQLLQIGNLKVTDRYIFSGYKTDTAPFSRDENYNIAYHGDNGKIQFASNQNSKVTVNITGQEAFLDGTNVFDVLRDLRDDLAVDNQAGVQEALPRLDEAMNQIVRERARVGTTIDQMETSKFMLEELGFQTENILSVTEDADIVETVSRLTTQETAFQATLKSTALVSGLTLINFI